MRTGIHIDDPCHEDWDGMQPVSGGRHCQACRKVVADFTGFSADEIRAYLLHHSGENVCGRVHKDVLEEAPGRSSWRLKPQWLAGMLGLLGLFWQTKKLQAQNVWVDGNLRTSPREDTVSPKAILSGKVLDEDKREFPFVNVGLYRNQLLISSTTTDMDGNFRMEVPKTRGFMDHLSLQFQIVGYRQKVLEDINLNKDNTHLKVAMNDEDLIVLGGLGLVMIDEERMPPTIPPADTLQLEAEGLNTPDSLHREVKDQPLVVFPNPSSGNITVSGIPGEAAELVIYDRTGARVASRPINHTETLDVSLKLPGGAYILRLLDDKGNDLNLSEKIIIY